MPTDRRDRIFLHLEKSIDRLKAQLAAARADGAYRGLSPRVNVLEREIDVREKVLEELREIT